MRITLENLNPTRKVKAGRDLRAAITVGVSAGVIVTVFLLLPPVFFLLLVMGLALYAEYEVSTAFRQRKINIVLLPVMVGTVGMLVSAFMVGIEAAWMSFLLTLVCAALWRLLIGVDAHAFRDVLATVLVSTYIPLGAVFVVLMQANPYSPGLLATWILATVANDTGGYVTGVLWGSHPLVPSVSPKKTWEGFAGSVGFTVTTVSLCLWLMGLNPGWGLVLGGFTALVATLGDLGESLIKRSLKVKDMGSVLPGHGGVMDRLDSLLLTAPLFFLWFFFLVL